MDFFIHQPSSYLSQYVKAYWMIENIMVSGKEHLQRIVPSGLFELSFYLADIPQSLDNRKLINENSMITGQIRSYFDIKVKGSLSLFSIYFYPHGLAKFIDIPTNELYNQTIPLKFIINNITNELEDSLSSKSLFSERINIVEHFLESRIKTKQNDYKEARIKHCINLINKTKGQMDINSLASEICLSRKQFERLFTEYIGVSPKQFLKTIRFQNAINIKSNKDISLTKLAIDSGYYDQSHMIADFLSLSGKTPKEYFVECTPYSDYFQ